jgi:hypothetical protein
VGDIAEEVLRHQYIYMPWEDGLDAVEAGKELALYVARERRGRLTVVCPVKSNATDHDELAKLPIVTERSGAVVDGGVVLAWCPTYKVMEKLGRLHKSVIVLVEWPPERFDGWAKLVGAYNALTGEVMASGLSAAGLKILEQIVFEGYKGWHDQIAEHRTLSLLADLTACNGYDREFVLAYARTHKSSNAMERLERILSKFERRSVTRMT